MSVDSLPVSLFSEKYVQYGVEVHKRQRKGGCSPSMLSTSKDCQAVYVGGLSALVRGAVALIGAALSCYGVSLRQRVSCFEVNCKALARLSEGGSVCGSWGTAPRSYRKPDFLRVRGAVCSLPCSPRG